MLDQIIFRAMHSSLLGTKLGKLLRAAGRDFRPNLELDGSTQLTFRDIVERAAKCQCQHKGCGDLLSRYFEPGKI